MNHNDPEDARITLLHVHVNKETKITNASGNAVGYVYNAINIGGITVFLDKEAAWKLVNVALEILQVKPAEAPEPITIRDVVDDGGVVNVKCPSCNSVGFKPKSGIRANGEKYSGCEFCAANNKVGASAHDDNPSF